MYRILSITIVLFMSACSENNSKEEDIDNSYMLATKVIEHYTAEEYMTLKNKLTDPTLTAQAEIWNIKAEKVRELTKEVKDYVDSCFENISESNLTPTKLSLLQGITKYNNAILQIDPEIWNQNKKDFSTLIDSAYYAKFRYPNNRNLYKNKTHNSISIVENRAVTFCNRTTALGCVLTYEKFSALIGQNSKHFKSGDELVITAGVGSYSVAAQPKISIENKYVTMNETGYVEFKKQITSKPGKYSVPVKIKYTNSDGTLKESEFQIEYDVIP